jgi:4-hydroxy-3-methylbut-2-en-1-yl diphosphate synthase IspG/GcpE
MTEAGPSQRRNSVAVDVGGVVVGGGAPIIIISSWKGKTA